MAKGNLLTDLEGAALAKVARDGKCTSYAIARSFAGSPSEFWSGSAGAVYPLVRRLLARGLLVVAQSADGKRNRSDYSLTAKGRTALRSWLLDSARAAGLGFDPLRTRVMHLDMVSARERAAFFAGVTRRLEEMAETAVWPDSARDQRIHAAVLSARRKLMAELIDLTMQDPDNRT